MSAIDNRISESGEQIIYEVYNETLDSLWKSTTDMRDLKKYLQLCRERYPDDKFTVLRVTLNRFIDVMQW
jgi:hypothetical protein